MKNARMIFCLLFVAAMVLSACAAPAPSAPSQPAATSAPAQPTAAPAAPQPTEAPAVAAAPAATQPITTSAAITKAASAKVAILFGEPMAGEPWDLLAYAGLQTVKAAGDQVAYSENVTAPDMEGAFRDYASQGYNIVIGHSDGFQDAALKAAKDFPNTMFVVDAGTQSASNVAAFNLQEQQESYLVGVVAASMSKSGTIGFIAGFEYPSLILPLNGYNDGAKSVNPNIKMLVSWVGSWGDPDKGQQLAQAMYDKGADVIFEDSGGNAPGIWKAAVSNKKWVIKDTSTCMQDLPDVCLTSADDTFDQLIPNEVKMYHQGQLKGQVYNWGIKEQGVDIGPINPKVPQDIQDKVAKLRADIISGALVIPAKYTWNQ